MKKNFLVASGLVLALVLLLAAFPVQAWYSPCFCTTDAMIGCGTRCLTYCTGGCLGINEIFNRCAASASCTVAYEIMCGTGIMQGGPCGGSEYCPSDCNLLGGGPWDPPIILPPYVI